ncbi:MAG: S1C family serine protease [Burkholderiales bacterium]|nr:S1C family serine protease [Burkholderiales bacterium]
MIARLVLVLAVIFVTLAGAGAQAQVKDAGAADTLSAIVRVRAKILPDARSLATLGPLREGSGVLVRDGYVATIGYLVLEAESVEVTGADGRTVPAKVVGYDHASGFGLLRLGAPIAARPLVFGDSASVAENDPLVVAGFGGPGAVSFVRVVSRRPFSGSWEYLLDSAIWTYPAVPNWSGAALLGPRGELLGIGSLIVADAAGIGVPAPGNLFVPIDLLVAILDELIAEGRARAPARPWLGMNTEELRGRLVVTRVSPESPAERAGVRAGDVVLGVGPAKVGSLAEFYRRVWALGAAGVEVPLRVLQSGEERELRVRSIDRLAHLRRPAGD